ncbi:hypothetical protein ACFV24_21845 [Nocardia fluminea]|uniref:hypothetical protein n=1 Tax=Nocardia fluminea TaxID=134984 RepID=UPI003670D7BA
MYKSFLTSVAIAGTVLTSGCGTSADENTIAAGPSTTSASDECAHDGSYPASPTVDLLRNLLDRGLDPAVPAAAKVELLQSGEGDPEFFGRMLGALNEAGFKADIESVTDYCNGTANADATLTFYNTPNASQVPLVADAGKWKLERVWACGLAASLQQTSPICS